MVKKEIPHIGSVEMPQNIPYDVARYEKVLADIHDIYSTINPALGRDAEKTQLRELKADAAKRRGDLQKDIDEQTAKMKDSLNKVLDPRSVGFAVGLPAEDPKYDDKLLTFLTLDADSQNKMPKPLGQQWDDYLGFVKDFGNPAFRKDATVEEETLNEAKRQYVRFLQGVDQYTGDPRESDVPDRIKAYRAAIARFHEAKAEMAKKPAPENAKKKLDAAPVQLWRFARILSRTFSASPTFSNTISAASALPT